MRALARFIPSSNSSDLQTREFYSVPAYSLIIAQCCDKCLRIIHYIFQVDVNSLLDACDTRKVDEVDVPVSLVVAIVRILAGVERNLNWFPVLLRASDIFQVYLRCSSEVLILH